MPLNQVPGQNDILAQLRTIPVIPVYEGQYLTDGAKPPMWEGGIFQPYITTVFGATYQGHDRGIVSERYNSVVTTVTVYCVAPTDKISRQYLDTVREKLTGFIPTDGTQLAPYGGYNYVDADLGANRYVNSAVFRYTTNMAYSA